MSKAPGKIEYRLEYSDREGVVELSGAMADAKRIQNVLFGHSRAGESLFGADITSYVMEFSDSATINEIRSKVSASIAKWCPDVEVRQVAVELLPAAQDPTGRGTNTLIIGLSIGSALGDDLDFAVIATQDIGARVRSSLVV